MAFDYEPNAKKNQAEEADNTFEYPSATSEASTLNFTHSIEPELTRRVPRRIRTSHRVVTPLLLCGLFLSPFVFFGLWYASSVVQQHILHEKHANDMITTGQIEDVKEETDSDDDWASDLVTFTFMVDGRPYRGTESVKEHAQKGKRVFVSYLPENPASDPFAHINQATRPDISTNDLLALCLIGLVVGVHSMIYVLGVWAFFKHRSIYVCGKVAVARIYDNSGSKLLSYSFEAEEDRGEKVRIKNTQTVSQEFWNSVKVGQLVTVLYRPTKPKDCVIYPSEYFRVIG